MEALIPKITDAGLEALLNANSTGVDASVSHIAFGDAGGERYEPNQFQTTLKNELVRIPIGGGEKAGPFEIIVQGLLDTGPTFTINEVGFILSDGTLLAIWAEPNKSLAYKTAGIPLAVAYNLALKSIPPDSLTLNVSGPSVNLTIVGPIAQTATEVIRLQRRAVESENARLIPQIQSKWR